MPHIEQLSPHVADLIAAGEVVERPASAVKELVENALDAGAKNITVELQNGGMTYLRITDDGCGIAPDELPTAFLRHATSKLRTAADLAAIGTLGFRGEALAAIAAVSRIDIFTRRHGAESGATLHLEGGKAGETAPAGCPEGTSIVVRDLFYNTPARLKFMKQDRAEATAIASLTAHIALSHPSVAFRLIKDGREELHTPGDGKARSAVYAALGREFALSLVELRAADGALSVSGFVTKPTAARGTRAMQCFFVNGRFVKSQLLTAAVEEAYANRIMKGRFPGCVLHLTIPCDMVDVNVHPAKTIVKFVSEKQVFDLVYHAAKDALDADERPAPKEYPARSPARAEFFQTMTAEQYRKKPAALTPDGYYPPVSPSMVERRRIILHDAAREQAPYTAAPRAPESDSPIPPHIAAAFLPPEKRPAPPTQLTLDDPAPVRAEAPAPVEAPAEAPAPPAPAAPERVPNSAPAPFEPEQTTLEPAAARPWRIAGEVLHTYIVCEDEESSVWLIDKHAAHERINFDRYKANLEPIMSQQLLTPVVAQLGAVEYAAVLSQLALLADFGFSCEDFGDGALLIRAIPADIAAEDAAASLEELGARFAERGSADPESARDALLHTMACKAAIKGGWTSDEAELRALVERVQSGEVRFCPHGRPVAVKLTKYELEKMFKRA